MAGEIETLEALLEALNDSLGHPIESPCGHSSIYAVSDDGGAHIRCLVCRELKLAAEIESLRTADAERAKRIKELESQNAELNKTLDVIHEMVKVDTTEGNQ
jgi:hypothetical protein